LEGRARFGGWSGYSLIEQRSCDKTRLDTSMELNIYSDNA